MPTPAQDLDTIEGIIDFLGKKDGHFWPGVCHLPPFVAGNAPPGGFSALNTTSFTVATTSTVQAQALECKDEGHPHSCDGAYSNGDYGPMSEDASKEDIVEALLTSRADTSEALGAVLRLIKGLQQQVVALDRMVKTHRHKVGEGHFSGRSEV